MENKKTNPPRTPFYTFARIVLTILAPFFYPFRVHNRERLSADAPFMIVPNHLTLFDPIVIAVATRKYEIRFLGKSSLRNNRVLRCIVDHLHMIPVVRNATDMMAMRSCLKTLKQGHVLCIFPEGTRKKEVKEISLEEMHTGAALIALHSKVKVLPVYISGKLRPLRMTDIYVGEFIDTAELAQEGVNKDTCLELNNRILAASHQMRRQHEQSAK